MEKRRSPWVAIILALVIGVMVIVLLNGVINPTTVVVAKVAIAPGTPLDCGFIGTAYDSVAGQTSRCSYSHRGFTE